MEKIIPLEQFSNVSLLYGNYNSNIKLLKESFKVNIVARDNIKVSGEEKAVEDTLIAIEKIRKHINQKGNITEEEIKTIVKTFEKTEKNKDMFLPVAPLTNAQSGYIQAIKNYDIVFSIGPSGTGKTYIAVAMAVHALQTGKVRKIVLVRPAVEAGEKLGFLPGDYQEKINPYLRPLYDALYDLIEYNKLKKYIERGIVEIAPLAYMRGRTLQHAFIILDEAQNSTPVQMKMFLTRLGRDSYIVVTGDVTQVDLPKNEESGLVHAEKILKGIKGIKFIKLTKKDIVRHCLVQDIVEAYENE